jgi:hypothetical protein
MRHTALAVLFFCSLSACCAAARPAKVGASVELRSGPGAKFTPLTTIPAQATIEVRRCKSSWCRAFFAGAEGYVAQRTVTFVRAPVDAPMLPPLGAHVWRHAEPPLFDPYESAGPWYTGPWVEERTGAVQWRYGFPGGHVDWFRKLGWRPGFGWY